ncbi:hypothetical protein B0H14DRAFT_2375593 [Mycena olivaceomarginata]|nr:hypothetical protein B0H14DRAFT_2375593 [Mycena olivaceomarginata]
MLHASFRDYLTDHGRAGSHRWFVDRGKQNQTLAVGCLRVLNTKLRFNIWGLKDSHRLNSDLSEKIKQHLAFDVSYASKHWANHLTEAPLNNEVLTKSLWSFINTRFLFWLEVVSMLELVGSAHEALKLARTYAQVRN